MDLGRRHWVTALGVAALLHAGLVALFYRPAPLPAGTTEAGLTGIEIVLGPAGSAPGAAGVTAEPIASDEDIRQPDEVAPAGVIEQSASQSPGQPVVEAGPVGPAPPSREAPAPVAAPTVSMATHAVRSTEGEVSTPMRPLSSRVRGADGEGGASDGQPPGEGETSADDDVSGARRDYLATLSAWLERHKRYPRRAQRRRQEGTVYLHFVVDREGRVVSCRIERTSGHAVLDRAVEEMVRRAEPFPAIPNELREPRLELIVPVSFHRWQ